MITEPIDVRAVLEDFANLAAQERNDDGETERKITKAIAAFDELICAAEAAAGARIEYGDEPEVVRLYDAIASARGAA